jgi:glycosyltransferase involved in cell wall biosynthesis
MRIALMGTRGVPAMYGGFETCVEEVGRRLAQAGHEVVVYCRRPRGQSGPSANEFLDMSLVQLPALRKRSLETLSHTALSTADAVLRRRFDAVLLFNAANSVFIPWLRLRRFPIATHVDGLEWRRAKWGKVGRRYYRLAEALSVRWSTALIADAEGIREYYEAEFGAPTELIRYGAPIIDPSDPGLLSTFDVEPRRFHLVVARIEPENHVDVIVEGYVASAATYPLIVVGSAPYADAHFDRIRALADDRVRLVGSVWDQDVLNALYSNTLTYLHGHSVGGTNPSLLRAIGAGAATDAYDVSFNREVVGDAGRFWRTPADVAALVDAAEADPATALARGAAAQRRAEAYTWDDVAKDYEALCERLASGELTRPGRSGRRRKPGWRE